MSDDQSSAEGEKVEARAIVAGHGDFASGLVSAVDVITGRGSQLIPVAVPGLCAEDIEKLIRQRMTESGVKGIFTDLQAGGCTMGGRRDPCGVDAAGGVAGGDFSTPPPFFFCVKKGARG